MRKVCTRKVGTSQHTPTQVGFTEILLPQHSSFEIEARKHEAGEIVGAGHLIASVASFGRLKAPDRFDPNRGLAFSSFAVPTIVGELKRYFRDLGWSAHVPRGAQELALKIQRAQKTLTTSTGRSPTVHELAEYMELSIERGARRT